MVVVIGSLAGMTTGTGHHLPGSWIEHIFPNRMGKDSMLPVTFAAHIIDGGFQHRRMVGTVGCMAIVAGIRHLVLEFCRLVPFEGGFVTIAANMTFFSLEQPVIIAGMR
jgi:hypothetical protein